MKRTETRRVVEYDADDVELQDTFDGSNTLGRAYTGSLTLPDSAREFATNSTNSLRMTMTPTTRFLEQPILLDMAKDNTSTGSSTTLPGVRGRDGVLRGQYDPIMHDELLHIHYRSPHMVRVAIAGIVGIVAGAILNSFNLHFTWQVWIGLCGYMFLRLLECLALPLIFTSATLGVAQLVRSSKGTSIMIRLALMFVTSAFLASGIGLLTGFAMSPTFTHKSAPPVALPSVKVKMQCPNEMYMTLSPHLCDGKLLRDAREFTITNITGVTLKEVYNTDIIEQDVAYSTQIVNFFTAAFQQNITEAFTTASYLGIVIFAMFVGAGIVASQDFPDMYGQTNHLYHVLKQVDVVLEWLLNKLIFWIPMGTFDAMMFTIMTGTLTNHSFKESMYLPLALLVALTVNFFLVVCVAYWALVRKNPFTFFWYLLPALIYMLASQRYMATIPIMMRSIENSKQVSRTLAQFSISLGTALSMCGHACFFSVSCVFMAYTSGLESNLTPGRVILLVIISALSSFGSPQENGASLTCVATIWRTVFGSAPPPAFAFVVSMEWLTVRMRRVHNITVVAFIARVIAEQLDERPEDEEDRDMVETQRSNELSPF